MVPRTLVLALVAVLVVVLAPAVVAPASAADTGAHGGTAVAAQSPVSGCAATQPADLADPEGGSADVVGWVDGYWYDEPLDIDISNGLNETELDRFSARTAARFETLRCLTVQDGLPPVDVLSREEFQDNQGGRFADIGETTRLVDNARFETMLTIDSETDSIDVREADSSERVGGFYDPEQKRIVVVSENPDAVTIDESTLAHELGHAIQDQHFDIGEYDRSTVDRDKGILGLIEGDINLVQQRYRDACSSGVWEQECETEQRAPGGLDIPNWGVYFEQIQPYSDGPPFIQDIEESGGWEAVNKLYDDPPTTALHTVYPETYGEIEPLDVAVPDQSTDEWERVVLEDVPTADGPMTHDVLGISSIAAMFAAPGYEEDAVGSVIPRTAMLNPLEELNPHDFAHPETEGWRGDALYTYTNASNETATVWETAWASGTDAEPFVAGYEQLVDIRGGERVDGFEYTYTFGEDSDYDMALTLVPDGDRVTVVTAPTVDALTAVDQDLELVAETPDNGSSDGSTDDGSTGDGSTDDGSGDGNTGASSADDGSGDDSTDDGSTDDGSTDDPADGTESGADGSGPGFGAVVVAGALMLFAAALLARRGR